MTEPTTKDRLKKYTQDAVDNGVCILYELNFIMDTELKG